MKQSLLNLSLSVAAIALSSAAISQTITWQATQSIAASSYKNQHPRVVITANGNPAVLWGNSVANSAYFSRWSGSSFTTPVKLNPTGTSVFADSWAGPDIAAKGDTVYVVYKVQPEDTAGIYVLRSVNGGSSFGAPVRVDNIGMNSSRFPTITTDAVGQPIVGFMKFNSGFTSARWVVSRSMNWGASFMPDVLASSYNSEPVCDCCPGTVVSNGTITAMLYRNNWNNKRTIWTGLSANSGTSFPTGMEIDNTNWNINACPSSGPDGVIVGDTLYATYMSGAGGTKSYYSKSRISTAQGGSAMLLTGTSTGITGQNFPRMVADGNAVAIVWPQQENNLPEVAILLSTNVQNGFGAWQKVVTNAANEYIMNADVAMKNGAVYVVWEDMASGTVKYRKGTFSDATGITEMKSSNELSLAPIPSNDELHISLQKPEVEPCSIIITDITGRMVLQQVFPAISGALTIPTSTLPAGIYLLKMATSAGVIAKKFVVSH